MTALESNIGNAVEVTLDAQLNSGSGNTTLDMASDPGIAAPAYLVLNPDNDSKREVVKWTSGAFGSATIERDKDNKNSGNGYTHAAGDTVRQAVVKQHFEDAHDAIQQGFVLEDGDGTEVTINPAVASGVYTQREVKFVEGGGIDIDWTDTDNGTDGDPYDLTFTVTGLTVAQGGTGVTSLTDKAVLISQDTGTDAVGAVALTSNGQIIIGGADGPAAATITAGDNITITNAANAITITGADGFKLNSAKAFFAANG